MNDCLKPSWLEAVFCGGSGGVTQNKQGCVDPEKVAPTREKKARTRENTAPTPDKTTPPFLYKRPNTSQILNIL